MVQLLNFRSSGRKRSLMLMLLLLLMLLPPPPPSLPPALHAEGYFRDSKSALCAVEKGRGLWYHVIQEKSEMEPRIEDITSGFAESIVDSKVCQWLLHRSSHLALPSL